ncbi:MAG: hypothetical protein ACJAZP_001499 [Psychromonas sp.]|jgi:hypothetical protein|uniref:DUF3261 domain-containing protein n=1 Tax=Psychromonas sp. TaxID=1884585 RepID=UPI0039E36A7E
MKKNCFILLLCTLLFACSMQKKQLPVQVEVGEGLFVTLPTPAMLGHSLNVSQLISAQWGQTKQQKLQMQLQVDSDRVVLVGFSAWGAPLLKLTYTGERIQTSVMAGLENKLPKPQQVLLNLMLSLWPVSAWQKPLDNIGWKLTEQGLLRQLIDQKGNIVAEIRYQSRPATDGLIEFKHRQLNYIITIETQKID